MASITGTVISLSGASGYDHNGEDFDILRDLLITADSVAAAPFAGIGLVAALDTLPDLTVFAPKDEAFIGLATTIAAVTGNEVPDGEGGAIGFLADTLTLLGGGDPSDLLTGILTYHVAGSVVGSGDLIAAGSVTTLSGGSFDLNAADFTLVDGDPGVPDPALDLANLDIHVDNGLIHVLDGVLLPLEVSAILTAPKTDVEIGGRGADTFETHRGADFIDGNGGSDTIRAGRGADVAIGGSGKDMISGGQGADTLLGESGGDTIRGGQGADMIDGGLGRDKILGGTGHDIIDGGAGHDTMNGGAGRDTFVFENGSGKDKVFGFRDGADKIDLSGYDGIDSFHDIEHQIGGGSKKATIDLGHGDTIALVGFDHAHLDAFDFIF